MGNHQTRQDIKGQSMIRHLHESMNSDQVRGRYIVEDGTRFYVIENVQQMPPFFMSLVSGSNHWAFIGSNGAITAGRHCANSALFPYYSSDKLLDLAATTGPLTIVQLELEGQRVNWEPFDSARPGNSPFEIRRHIYKNMTGTEVIFEEQNLTLNLTFRYSWRTGDRFGFIRSCRLVNLSDRDQQVRLLDGLQNILPAGIESDFQMRFSNLGNAYKKNELVNPRLGVYYLSSIPSDRAEPSEGLRCTTVWRQGLADAEVLLTDQQIASFTAGQPVTTEQDARGQKGCYLVCQPTSLAACDSISWSIVADVQQDHAAVVDLVHLINAEPIDLLECLRDDAFANEQVLKQLISSADGAQCSGIPQKTDRHWSNVTFNVMRGGVPIEGYQVSRSDWFEHLSRIHPQLAADSEAFANEVFADGDRGDINTLIRCAESSGNLDLVRIAREYLPFAFSRRHGDPTRPWNIFAIDTRHEDGSIKLNYQGNWRDIFQNWEALALSYPGYLTSMVYRFVNASTVDGHNPYRVTKEGFDWERLDPKDAWANIGYWGDHQIIYLLKLIELAQSTAAHSNDGLHSLTTQLNRPVCVFANVPYRIAEYSQMLEDPRNTIDYDFDLAEQIEQRVDQLGSDGKLLRNQQGELLRSSLFEKLLLTGIVKAANLIPGAGLWLNTQRPEWNDANNALVGIGASVVTACYLRRYFDYLANWIDKSESSFEVDNYLFAFSKSVESIYRQLDGADLSCNETRRAMVDQLQQAATDYRNASNQPGRFESRQTMPADEFVQLARAIVTALDQTITENRRPDDLYHAYNLIRFGDDDIQIEYLYEMLEGQVAVLSSGMLSPEQSVDTLKSLWSSQLYRADQDSFLLYPDRDLPRFLEKNQIDPESVQDSPLVSALLDSNATQVIRRDAEGHLRFAGHLRNATDLKSELEHLKSSRPEWVELIQQHGDSLCDTFATTFEHHRFTGRSGTFFGYEGLGSIYWHMVSKLGVAILEVYREAHQAGNEQAATQLRAYYRRLQQGIGCEKSPDQYGAFPTDPYSHTPAKSGVKQPGMTGQVKEDILTRFNELGVMLDQGQISFEPSLIEGRELLTESATFETCDIVGKRRVMQLDPGQLGFTFCQTPILYSFGSSNQISVRYFDQRVDTFDSLTLPADLSRSVLNRDNQIESILVQFDHTPV